MATFQENKEAIENNVRLLDTVAEALDGEVARAKEAEAAVLTSGNLNPVMYADALPPVETLTAAHLGSVYVLISPQNGYERGRFYKVVSDGTGFAYEGLGNVMSPEEQSAVGLP